MKTLTLGITSFASILAIGTALAQTPAPTLGQRALVVSDTTVTVAASGGIVRRQKAGATCVLRAGSTVEFVNFVAGDGPKQAQVKRVATPTGSEAVDVAKKAPGAVVSPGKSLTRFVETCGFNRHVFVPAAVLDPWLAAQKAADAKIEADKAARGQRPKAADKKG